MNENSQHGRFRGHQSEVSLDIMGYLATLRRRWWVVLGAIAVSAGGTWWSQRGALPSYTAQVLLQQRAETAVIGITSGLSGGGFGSQTAILRSRAVLGPVMDSLGLQLNVRTHQNRRAEFLSDVEVEPDAEPRGYVLDPSTQPAQLRSSSSGEIVSRVDPDGLIEGPGFRVHVQNLDRLSEPLEFSIQYYEVAIQTLQNRVQVEPGGGSDLLLVRYRSPDPQHAAAVVNAVALSYQRHRMLEAREAAARRREVVAGEMESLADSVRRAQALLDNYSANTQLLDPNVEGTALISALLETENELRQLRFDRSLLEGLVAGLQTGDAEDESLSRVMALGRELVPAGPSLDQRLQDLQAERRALTVNRFGVTTSSPEVVVLDAQIASARQQMRITAEQSLALLQSRIDAQTERVSDLETQMGGLPARSSEYTRLQQQVDAVQGVFDRLVGNYYEAQIAESVEAGDVALVDPAPVPLFPDPSGLVLNLLIAMVAGLALGFGGAMLLEHFDDRVRRVSDAREASGLEVVGTVPRIPSGSKGTKAKEIGMEAFRGIRTNLRYVMPQGPQLLGVCSPAPREGKSTVTANLALSMVENGDRVLVVDADLRRARMHELLGVEQTPGLSEVLAGKASLADAIRISPLSTALHVLPSGSLAVGVSTLNDHKGLRRVFESLRERYDLVIVDTPPLLVVNDSSIVASEMDGNIIVVRSDGTNREALVNAVSQLHRVNARLVGLILNDLSLDSVGYSAYYDSYYQGTDEKRSRIGRRRRTKALTSG